MRTYKEYKVEMKYNGDWIDASTDTRQYPTAVFEAAQEYLKYSKRYWSSKYQNNDLPAEWRITLPTEWRIVSREVAVTEWREEKTMTPEDEAMIDEYMSKTDALVDCKNGKWTIDTPQQDYVYGSFGEMMNDIKTNLEEIEKLERNGQI